MGIAIARMHYTGMVALNMQPLNRVIEHSFQMLDVSNLAIVIGVGTLLILILTLLTSILERFLGHERRLLAAIVEFSNEAIISTTVDGMILSWNSGASKILGYSASELKGRSIDLLVPLDSKHQVQQIFKQLKRGEHIEPFESVPTRKDGQAIHLLITISALKNAVGQIVGVSAIALDITEPKRIERELQKEQEFLNAVLENVSEGIVVCDADGILMRFNQASREFHGLPEQPFPPEDWAKHYNLYLPDGKTLMQKEDIPLFRALQGETILNREMVIVPKQGKTRTLLTSGQVIVDAKGEKLGAVVVMHDITKRKIIEAALFESESRLNSILNSIQDVVWSIDFDTFETIYLNPATEKLQGRPCEDFFNNPYLWYEVIHPEDRQSIDSYIGKLVEAGTQELEYRIIRPDGEVRWTVNKSWLIYDKTGKPIRIDGLASDITERKLVDAALRQSETQLAEAQKVAQVGSWELDLTTQVVTWSNELFRIFGTEPKPDPLTYEDYTQKVHPDDAEVIKNAVTLAITEGKSYELDQRIVLPDGSIKYISSRGRPVFNQQGQIIKLFGTVLDITSRKQAEEELSKVLAQEKELVDLKSRFISVASHEFRTPLTTIQISADSIEHYSHKWTEEKKLTALRRIQASVKRMTGLLNDVLLVSQAESGKLEFNPVPLDLAQWSRELIEEIQLSIGSSHTINFINLGEGIQHPILNSLPRMDEKLLRYIFNNLLSNAIKYSPPSSQIYFKLVIQDGRAIFEIQDSGIGIPPEDQARIFEAFHRSKNVGTTAGTGLGLSIVSNSVKTHRGVISVESQVGKGTTFTVNLPLNY